MLSKVYTALQEILKLKKDSFKDKEVKEVAADGSLQDRREKTQTEVMAQHHGSGLACCQDSWQPT